MKYLRSEPFSVGGASSQQYRDNYDRIFGKKAEEKTPADEWNEAVKVGTDVEICVPWVLEYSPHSLDPHYMSARRMITVAPAYMLDGRPVVRVRHPEAATGPVVGLSSLRVL